MASLERARARAVVFPMHEPAGYPPANDRVLEAAGGPMAGWWRSAASTRTRRAARGGALPRRWRARDQAAPAGRAVHAVGADRARPDRAGARPPGARAHPRRPRDPGARPRHGAAVGRVPGRASDPRARRDLRPRVAVARAPRPSEPVHRHRVVGPGGHDGPVHARAAGERAVGERRAVRAAAHLRGTAPAPRRPGGLGARALRSIAGGQIERLLEGADPVDAGPPPLVPRPLDPLLERVVSHTAQAVARTFGQGDPEEPVALARLACAVGGDGPHAGVFAAVVELLDLYDANLAPPPDGRRYPLAVRLLVAACTIARTPDVPSTLRRSRSGCRTGPRRGPRRAPGAPRRRRRGRA